MELKLKLTPEVAQIIRKLHKYKVTVTMKPVCFTDLYLHEPTKTQVLEQIAESLLDGRLNDAFSIEAKEESG